MNVIRIKGRLRRTGLSRKLKIFISSPGDVIPERQVARKVIGELNEEMMGKVFLVPVLWEQEPLLASGNFQTQIDSPEGTDILLGILWTKIGSPLPESMLRTDGTRYDSGTAFEFESALAGYKKNRKPDILLYRKLGAPSISLDNQEEVMERMKQINLLDAYIKKHLMAEDGSYIAAFHTFETEEQFETILKTHLRKLILKQLEKPEVDGEKESDTLDDTKVSPSLPDTLSVAVLPFDNMSKDHEQEFFADGLTEDIITELSRFKDLDVIARNSSFQYKGQSVDVRQVGQELGARYVLEGSVRKAGNALRVTGQLLDAKDGSHLWAETYNRDLSEVSIFDVQDELSGQFSSTIGDLWGVLKQVQFEKLKQEDLEQLNSEQSVAYALATVQRTGYHSEARHVLELAAGRDPNNGHVQALLTHAYIDEHTSGDDTTREPLERALRAAQKAVELQPKSDRTHNALARANFHIGEIGSALAEAKRAVQISPNSGVRLAQQATILVMSGNSEQGLEIYKRAQQLMESMPPILFMGLFINDYQNERYENALETLHKLDAQKLWILPACFAATYARLDNPEKANVSINSLLSLLPDFGSDPSGYLERYLGSSEGVETIVDGLRKAGLEIKAEPRNNA